ncbi:tetratricopeptide repeat protein [Arenibaculum pallidiluteum]|uniref:tetratricopeptide repeat protein n=1 Tax=Arenibaculum pallidiluteum TaxID=2812559 RepID=UPI001A95BB34|nr:tetratricopeptide repeat protein [Arenibaculum pallidiluteum]
MTAQAALAGTDLAALLSEGLAHHGRGDLPRATACYRAVLAAEPGHAEALHLSGVAAYQLGRNDEAARLIRQAIARRPDSAHYHNNLGSALKRLGRHDEALEAYREALRLEPRQADAAGNMARLLRDLGRTGEALDAFRQALANHPSDADLALQAGSLMLNAGAVEEAIALYRRTAERPPGHAGAFSNLGVALRRLGRLDEAVDAYRASLRLDGAAAGTWSNLGVVLADLDRYAEAISCQQRAISHSPAYAEAHLNLSLALMAERRHDKALAAAREAVRLKPDLAEGHTQLASVLLMLGRYAEGWAAYEWRTRMPDFPSPVRSFPTPRWDGGPLSGRCILVHDEQGVGDAFQFARFVPLLARQGATVILECNARITGVMRGLDGAAEVVARGMPVPAHDVHVPLLSLPHLLGTTLATIPTAVPYLRPEPERQRRWAELLKARDGGRRLRVGLVWAGNPEYKADRIRSPGLKPYLPLLDVPDIAFYALQQGAGRRDLDGFPGHPSFTDLVEAGNWDDTAAVMANLDLVISSCTGPAHLAGALGRPLWVVLPHAAEWRWLEDIDDSPWYPTARLYRQPRQGDWDSVLLRVRDDLRRRVGR